MSLSDPEGHLPISSLFQTAVSYSCTHIDKVSTGYSPCAVSKPHVREFCAVTGAGESNDKCFRYTAKLTTAMPCTVGYIDKERLT